MNKQKPLPGPNFNLLKQTHVSLTRFNGRWGTYACPQCLPRTLSLSEERTWTLRPPAILHRPLPYHTIPYYTNTVPWVCYRRHNHTIPYALCIAFALERGVRSEHVAGCYCCLSVLSSTTENTLNRDRVTTPRHCSTSICVSVMVWLVQMFTCDTRQAARVGRSVHSCRCQNT